MYIGQYPPIRETKTYRKYFHGKMQLLRVKKVLVKKGNAIVIEDEVEEFVTGR